MASDYVIVLTTLPLEADATAFARRLVEEKLVACVNVLPAMTSTYAWEGKVEEASERQVVMKTEAARVEALRERIQSLHSYAVPEFLVIPATGSEAYLKWIRASVAEPIGR
jgi:periplasmic divalent cation tolerance protein